MPRAPKEPTDQPDGVWITHRDGQNVTVYSSEIKALRDAVGETKTATRLPYGVPLNDVLDDGYTDLTGEPTP